MGTTSNTPETRPRSTAGRPTPPGEPGPAPVAKAAEGRSELARTLGIVALAVLMGLTSWAIASVSTWMVPAYVTVMVLIFATPRSPRREGAQEETPEVQGVGTEPPMAEPARLVDAEDRPRRGRKASSRSRTQASPEVMAPAESTEDGPADLRADGPEASLDSANDPAEPPSARPRRTRGRARRTARPGAEPAPAPPPATWIQVAPGKFVRADLQEPRIEDAVPGAPAGAHDVTPEPEPASPLPTEALAAVAGTSEPVPQSEPEPQPLLSVSPDLPEEPVPIAGPPMAKAPVEDARIEAEPEPTFDPPAPSDEPEAAADPLGDLDAAEGPEASADPPGDLDAAEDLELDAEPAAEEYGIAPSALGDDPLTAPPPEADDGPWHQAASPDPEDDLAFRPDEPECDLDFEAATPIEPAPPDSFEHDEDADGLTPEDAYETLDEEGWDRDEGMDEDAAVPAALAMEAIAGQGRDDDERDRASTADDADIPDDMELARREERPAPASRSVQPLSCRASVASAVRVRNIRTGPPARSRVLKASPPPRGTRTPCRRNTGRRPGASRHFLPRSPPRRS